MNLAADVAQTTALYAAVCAIFLLPLVWQAQGKRKRFIHKRTVVAGTIGDNCRASTNSVHPFLVYPL